VKRFKFIITIRYQDAKRKLKGIHPAKDYTQCICKLAEIADLYSVRDANPQGKPITITVYLRELESTPARRKRPAKP
jgi:hypothetical protein